MRESTNVSLVTVVRNGADDLRRLLAYHKPYFSELIVVVQQSDDDTLAVARELADKVVESDLQRQSDAERLKGEQVASSGWICCLDVDEYLARPHTIEALPCDSVDVWLLARHDVVSGFDCCVNGQDWQPRLYRKGVLQWTDKSHTHPEMDGLRTNFAVELWLEHIRDLDKIIGTAAKWVVDAENRGDTRAAQLTQDHAAECERRIKRIRERGNPKILCSYNGVVGIGDTLMTTPALRELRERYPNARIDYVTQQGVVLKHNPNVNKVYDHKPEQWDTSREDDYDIVIHWECSLTGDPGRRVNGYELETWWAFLDTDSFKPEWYISAAERIRAEEFLRANVKTPRAVGMALSASCIHRTWQFSNEFCEKLLAKYPDITLIFFGDAICQVLELRENLMTREVRDEWGVKRQARVPYDGPGADRVVRTAGLLPLRDSAAIISKLDAMICPDSGLMHVAGCFDIPTVAYFNLVPHELRVKHLPNVIPVQAEYECSPCFVHGSIDCEKTTSAGAPCLATVTVDRMLAAAEEVLG